MKSYEITQLPEAQFIYELTLSGSRVNSSPLQWTHEWLKARGASTKPLKGLGDWSGNTSDQQALNSRKADIISCIESVMNAQRSAAGRKSGSSMTPEQRTERAKKAAAARIAKQNQK